MKAKHLPTGNEFEITGSCNFRKEDESLWIAVSYLEGEETKTNEFPINEETDEIIHDDYTLINE